jgi:hypothetical protein
MNSKQLMLAAELMAEYEEGKAPEWEYFYAREWVTGDSSDTLSYCISRSQRIRRVDHEIEPDWKKLQAIKAKCQEMLAIAEKRTPGKWDDRWNGVFVENGKDYRYPSTLLTVCYSSAATRGEDVWPQNSAFIASCAGPAEAGWRSTIAAIDDWLDLFHEMDAYADGAPDAPPHDRLCNSTAHFAQRSMARIISAWEDQL